MSIDSATRAALAVAALGSFAIAQTTWVVSAFGGGHFTDIPPALAVASHGDALIVRPGVYTPFTTSLGVAIVGDEGALFAPGRIVVRRLPAGEQLVLAGFRQNGVGLDLIENQGQVHLQHLHFHHFFVTIPGQTLLVQDCAQVTMTLCAFSSDLHGIAARITNSSLDAAWSAFGGGTGVGGAPGTLGILAFASTATFAQCSIEGGDVGLANTGMASAIEVRTGYVTIAGAASRIEGGEALGIPGSPRAPAVVVWPGATVVVEAALQIAVGGIAQRRPLASLVATDLPGQQMQVSPEIPVGWYTVLVASLPAATSVTPLGRLLVDPTVSVPMFTGHWPGNPLGFVMPFPPVFAPGTTWRFQAGVSHTSGLELTNSATLTLRVR